MRFLFSRTLAKDKGYGDVLLGSAILGASAVFAVFLADVFSDFSINSLIFWFYLGTVMAMVRTVTRSEEKTRGTAIVCDTPLQVMNCLQWMEEDQKHNGKYRASYDLYVYMQFRNADKIAKKLRETGRFGAVIEVPPLSYRKKGQFLSTFLRLCMPKRVLRRLIGASSYVGTHERLVLCFFTPFTDLVRKVEGRIPVVLVEDGVGSYLIEDLEHHYRSAKYRLINRYVFSNALEYSPEESWLHRPEWGFGVIPKKKLPNYQEASHLLPLLRHVFSFVPHSAYFEHSHVYLTQPLSEKMTEGKERAWKEHIAKRKDCLVRLHPREERENYSLFSHIDNGENLWELDIAEGITDQSVLLAAFSTAQIMPYLLYGLEPRLIFAFPYLGGDWGDAERLIANLKKSVKCPERIVCVSSAEELDRVWL